MAVDLAADGGLDALGNWHDTDGKFQKRGVSTAKALAVKAVRGLAAAAMVKDRPDGADLDLNDRAPAGLVDKLGSRRTRVTWHNDRHGAVTVGGRRMLVPWAAFDDPPDAPDAPDGPDAESPFASITPDGQLHRATTKGRTYDPTGPQGAVYFTGSRDYAANYGDEVTTVPVPDRSRVPDIRDPADRARLRSEAKAVLAEAEAKLPDIGPVYTGAKPFVADAHRWLDGDDTPNGLAVALANVSTVINYAENPDQPYRAGTAQRRILDRLDMDAMTDVESHALDDLDQPGGISFAFRSPPGDPVVNEMMPSPDEIDEEGSAPLDKAGHHMITGPLAERLAALAGEPDAEVHYFQSPDERNNQLMVGVPSQIGPLGIPIGGSGRDITRMSWKSGSGEIVGLLTEPRYQRKGMATALFDAATKLAEATGAQPPKHSEILTTDGAAWAAAEKARATPTVNDLVEAPPRPRGALDIDPGELPAPVVPEGLTDAENAARRAVERLNEIHHEDVGINGVSLATLPTIAGNDLWAGRTLDPATQRLALDRLFRPANTDGLITALPIVDETDTNRGRPLGAVAVNTVTGAIIGTHAPWSPNTAPPYGDWVALPADHPQAAALVTAGWLASPEVKRYIDTDLLPRLRQGHTTDPAFSGLTEAARRNSDSIAAPYRGHPDIAVTRVTSPDGTHYVPDPDGRQSIDGDDVRFADFSEDGGTRLWVPPVAVNEPDATGALSSIDYTTVDDPDLPWDDRVAALAKVRAQIKDIFGPDPSAMFSQPTEDDVPDLLTGAGAEREFAHIDALERFGESLEALVDERASEARTPESSIDRGAIVSKLREIPGVPPALADFMDGEDWDAQIVGKVLGPRPGAPNGGGRVDITFPGYPESRVMVFTSVRGAPPETYVAWEFSPRHQMDLGPDRFEPFGPSRMMNVSSGHAPFDWFDDLNASNPAAAQPRQPSPTMVAWVETMEALGVDMGTDPDVHFALGRDRDGEMVGQPERGANPARYGDLTDDGILHHSAEVGLRAYPKAWTQRLGGRLIRIAVDDDRNRPVGASSAWPDVGVIDVPNVDKYGEFADTLTHEFAHQFEQAIPGLMLLETWHFIKRLRAEAKRTEKLATWEWDDQRFGFVDEFGDQYMGRVYRNPRTGVTGVTSMGGSEIFSTAAQTLWATEARNAADLDAPARRLLMATMATIEPPGLDPDERWRP